jgi:hypothetical protein
MAYNSTAPRVEYTASAGQTVFSFLFKIYTTTDIEIYKNDVLLLSSEYSVTINGDLGGSITLVTATSLSDSIVLLRNLELTRTVEYQTSGDLTATTINSDQNYQTYLTADMQDEVSTCYRNETTGTSNLIPAPIAGNILKWDATGTKLINDGSGIIPNSSDSLTVNTILELRALTVTPDTIYATGYHTANDGAFGSHFYRLATDTGQVDNGGTIIRTVNGVYELQYDGAVNVKWFGADATGAIDSSVAIQAAVGGYEGNGRVIFIPNGTYMMVNRVKLGARKTICGESREKTKLIWDYDDYGIGFYSDTAVHLKNLQLLGTASSASLSTNEKSVALMSSSPTDNNGWAFSTFENMWISGWGAGLSGRTIVDDTEAGSLKSLEPCELFSCNFSRIEFRYNYYDIYVGSSFNSNTFHQCRFWNTRSSHKIHMIQPIAINFFDCVFEGNLYDADDVVRYDFHIVAGKNVEIHNSYFEPARGGYYEDCTDVVFKNSYIAYTDFTSTTSNAFARANNNNQVYGVIESVWLHHNSILGTASGVWSATDNAAYARVSLENCYHSGDGSIANGAWSYVIDGGTLTSYGSNTNGTWWEHKSGMLEMYTLKQAILVNTTTQTGSISLPRTITSIDDAIVIPNIYAVGATGNNLLLNNPKCAARISNTGGIEYAAKVDAAYASGYYVQFKIEARKTGGTFI